MAKRPLKVGDMARVAHSIHQPLIGQVVILERWRPELGRWAVCLTCGPISGLSLQSGRPMTSTRAVFRESSLERLPDIDPDLTCDTLEKSGVVHG